MNAQFNRGELKEWKGALIPPEYEIRDNAVYKLIFKGDSTTIAGTPQYIVLCHNPCIISNYGKNIDTDESRLQLTFADMFGNDVTEWVQNKDVLTKTGIMNLTNKGLNIVEKKANDLADYLSKCIVINAGRYKPYLIADKNGWKQDNKLFVLGDHAYSSNDTKQPILMSDHIAKEGLHVKGTLDSWLEGVKGTISYDLVRFKCYCACSASLLNILNLSSCIVDNSGESSTGKSYSSRIAASLFGNYLQLESNGNATQVGIEIKAASYCDLPLFFDETATLANEQILKKIVYMLGNGQGRLRGRKELTLRSPPKWRTVALTTGEQPITSYESFTGQHVRVISIRGGLPNGMGEQIKVGYDTISGNYGHVAERYMRKLFERQEKLHDDFVQLRKEFSNTGLNTGDRVADHFAAFTLAGEILESIFIEIGLDARNPKEITKKYFEQCVTDRPIVSYSLRALTDAIDWMNANKKGFYDKYNNVPQGQKVYGFIEDEIIDWNPKVLKEVLRECKYSPERVLPEWYEMGLLRTQQSIVRRGDYCAVIKKNNKSQRFIRLKRKDIEEKLGLNDEECPDFEKDLTCEI